MVAGMSDIDVNWFGSVIIATGIEGSSIMREFVGAPIVLFGLNPAPLPYDRRFSYACFGC